MKRILITLFTILFYFLSAPLSATTPTSILAIWDFDGTILDGDCSEGLTRNGKKIYEGLISDCIKAGFSKKYKGEKGVQDFLKEYYKKLNSKDKIGAYADVATIFEGANFKALEKFCEKRFNETYRHYYFIESINQLNELSKKGVDNYIISASLEIFVRAAASSIGISKDHIYGIRIKEKDGVLTNQIEYPFPFGEGKTEIMRQLEKEKNSKALYGFGNSYSTDGPFLLAIVKQGGISTMINGGNFYPEMKKNFICRDQQRHINYKN